MTRPVVGVQVPQLTNIDHVHVYVPDREQAAQWFQDVLGFEVEESLRVWATDSGPLTIGDAEGHIHVALFEATDYVPCTAIAFGADGANFLQWKQLLDEKGVAAQCKDHDLAWSLYFHDPYDNLYEITTYEHEVVSGALAT